MSKPAKKKEYTLNQNKEYVASVCVDVIDLGVQDTPWGKRHQVKIVWETDQKKENGYPLNVSKTYNLSLHPESNLRKDLQAWRGRDFSEEELSGPFAVESMKDQPCTLELQDALSKSGNAYLKVLSISPAGEKRYFASGEYKRWVPLVVTMERKEGA
jgi:hypothetical protein